MSSKRLIFSALTAAVLIINTVLIVELTRTRNNFKENFELFERIIYSGVKQRFLSHSPSVPIEEYSTDVINPHSFAYLVNTNDSFCRVNSSDGQLLLLAFVPVSASNFAVRSLIRSTWAPVLEATGRVRVVFMLGRANDSQINDLIQTESRIHQDIVQEDFMDTYRNLSLKTMQGFKWTSEHCSNARFVLKIDDDVVVNVPVLMRVLNALVSADTSSDESAFWCKLNPNSPVNRNKTSKFYVPVEHVNQTRYRPYCDGPAYILTSGLARRLFALSLHTPLFYFEDIYVGHSLAANLPPRGHVKFNIIPIFPKKLCGAKKLWSYNYAFFYTDTPTSFLQCWKLSQNNSLSNRGSF